MLNVESNTKRRKSKTLINEVKSQRSSREELISTKNSNDSDSVLFDNYQHIIYEKAAIIYAYLKGEANVVLPIFADERIKRRAYSLAFGAKKCKQIYDTHICCLGGFICVL